MDGTEIALRLIGAFYAFAGVIAARAALTSNLVDKAIAALTLSKTEPVEQHRTIWLLTLSALIFVGGVCLILMLETAAWVFAAATIAQALFFLVLAPYYFDLADEADSKGRQQNYNAFVIYSACTFFVVWAAYSGRLTPLAAASPVLLGSAAMAIMLYVGYILRHTLSQRKSTFDSFDDAAYASGSLEDGSIDISADAERPPAQSKRLKVMADYGTYPLWQMDNGLFGDIAPSQLDVSPELGNDLDGWADAFDASLNKDDPANSHWSPERYNQHIEEGIALARRLKRELPEREVFVHNASGNLVEVTADDGVEA